MSIAVIAGSAAVLASRVGIGPGVTDNVAPMQAVLDTFSEAGGGWLHLDKPGVHAFDVNGDSDALVIPSNVWLTAVPGVKFRWDYWGCPLLAVVNVSNVIIEGITFQWSGTWGTTSGSSDKFSYGLAIPAYEWCSHIAVVGSEDVRIERCSCEGLSSSANLQNNFINIRGFADRTQTRGNQVLHCKVADVAIGIGFGEQIGLLIEKIHCLRYHNRSTEIYGPGHVVYGYTPHLDVAPGNSFITIDGVMDEGVECESGHSYTWGGYTRNYVVGSQTVEAKFLSDSTISRVKSKRKEGVLSVTYACGCDFLNLSSRSDDATDDTDGAVVFIADPATDPSLQSVDCRFSELDLVRANAATKLIGNNLTTPMLRCHWTDWQATGPRESSDTTPHVSFCAQQSKIEGAVTDTGNNASTKTALELRGLARECWGEVVFIATNASKQPRLDRTTTAGGTPTRNRVRLIPAKQDTERLALSSTGDTTNEVTFPQPHLPLKTATVTGSNPSWTLQLPGTSGTWLLAWEVQSTDHDHSRWRTYMVTYDDASTDYTSVEAVGAGDARGASAPSSLSVSVSATGLLTLGATAGSGDWDGYLGALRLKVGR